MILGALECLESEGERFRRIPRSSAAEIRLSERGAKLKFFLREGPGVHREPLFQGMLCGSGTLPHNTRLHDLLVGCKPQACHSQPQS